MLIALSSCDNLVVNFPTSLGCCSELLVKKYNKPLLHTPNKQEMCHQATEVAQLIMFQEGKKLLLYHIFKLVRLLLSALLN